MARGIKKLEGEKSDIGVQRNSSVSLMIDDPLQIAERYFERNVRFNKTEFQEIVYQPGRGRGAPTFGAVTQRRFGGERRSHPRLVGEPRGGCMCAAGYWQPRPRPVKTLKY
jgi:hypothetical protein